MKSGILIIILCQIHFTGTAQIKTDSKDSCLSDMHTITRNPIDANKTYVTKRKVPHMIASLKACISDYSYPSDYEDHSFQLIIPSFLDEISYGQGDNNFYYSFNDSNKADSLTAALTIQYDFNNSYRNYYLNKISKKPQTDKISKIGDLTLYQFTNSEGFLCGQIFLSHNMYLFYYTSNKLYEEKLQKALLTFKWD